MKKARIAKFAAGVAVFYFILAGFCQSIHAQSEIKVRLVHDTLVVVSVMANDQGPFDFILDTGTNSTVVDPSLARQLSLVALDRIQLDTLAGSQTVVRSSLRTLATGPARVEKLEVLVRDLSQLRKLDSHIQGMVGQNFMSHFNYMLDYRKHSLQIELANEIGGVTEGDQVRVETNEEGMLIGSEVQSRGVTKLRLLLDSGANSVVLMPKASKPLDLEARESWLEVTNTGQAGLKVGRIQTLTIGSQKFHDLAVALQDVQPTGSERVEDGVLPTALFHTLYVNNREGFVVFNPRTKKN